MELFALDFNYSIRLSGHEDPPTPKTTVITLPEQETRIRHEPRWYVILHDDQLHTYQYVIDLVVKIFGKSTQDALVHAIEVDTQSHTILARLPKPEAIEKRLAIAKFGGDPWMKTDVPMHATIEPVDD